MVKQRRSYAQMKDYEALLSVTVDRAKWYGTTIIMVICHCVSPWPLLHLNHWRAWRVMHRLQAIVCVYHHTTAASLVLLSALACMSG